MRPVTGVADPSRGTRVAIGIPLIALTATALWTAGSRPFLGTSLPIAVALLVVAAAAEHIVVQLGPRSWYTASTPVIVLAALLGGPLLGVAAGMSTQLVRPEAVWRRQSAEGGVAALQGLAAGIVGMVLLTGGNRAVATAAAAAAAAAMLVAVAVNSAGRFLIMLERRARPLLTLWRRGLLVDLLETALVVPLLSAMLIANDESPALVVTAMASLLAVLMIAQRSRATTEAALATEQANARRDQLTGAPNRRAFEEAMTSEHARVVRGGMPAGLFVIDVDRFKSVNDRFGHSVGDEALIEVVRRLTDGLRPSDVVARWGGEEITVLAPGVRGRRQLAQVGERIRKLVGDLPIATSKTALSLTVSVGGTLLDGSVPPATALDRADGALFEAKRTRDKSVISLPPGLTLRLESSAGRAV
jgi:diguanylate cyclase (GGDEF)-like protein